MTKTTKLIEALKRGDELTTAQIRRLGIPNPSAAVFYIRQTGVNVETTVTETSRGTVYKYRMPRTTSKKKS
jgi:hypothetical protein